MRSVGFHASYIIDQSARMRLVLQKKLFTRVFKEKFPKSVIGQKKSVESAWAPPIRSLKLRAPGITGTRVIVESGFMHCRSDLFSSPPPVNATDSDYRRQRDDDQTNNDLTKKLVVCEGVVSWMKTKWKDVSVGSILKIRVGTVGMI